MRHGVGPTTVLVGPCMNSFKIDPCMIGRCTNRCCECIVIVTSVQTDRNSAEYIYTSAMPLYANSTLNSSPCLDLPKLLVNLPLSVHIIL